MKNFDMRDVKITKGIYAGRVGKAEKPNDAGIVTFFSEKGYYPVMIKKHYSEVEYLN
jgi:hypothetical protein